jgi:putative SOS response-associated peptidase YedK
MCGRITLTSSGQELAEQFGLEVSPELRPRYNIAPSQEIATVRVEVEGRRVCRFNRWGLIPSWAKDPAIGSRMINARAETVAEKPSFRAALRRRRCIVPADGFYEWAGTGRGRQPHLFRQRDGAILAIAGLWEAWLGPEGDEIESCTLITTEANATMRRFHHRMPVLLDARDHSCWLDPGERDPERVLPLLAPCPPDWLNAVEVSRHVNNPGNDDPRCVEPLA